MLKFNKAFNVNIIVLTVSLSFLFTNMRVPASRLLKLRDSDSLRVPVGQRSTYDRLIGAIHGHAEVSPSATLAAGSFGTDYVPIDRQGSIFYVPQSFTAEDIERGFFSIDEGELWAPVIRKPDGKSNVGGWHGRSLYNDISAQEIREGLWTRVIKGCGMAEMKRGVPFTYEPHEIEGRQFWGGETLENARYAASIAQELHQEFERALLERDSAVLLAVNKYGITCAPTLRPLYILKPVKILVNGKDLINPLDAFMLAGMPPEAAKKFAEEYRVFVYEVPFPVRLQEMRHYSTKERKVWYETTRGTFVYYDGEPIQQYEPQLHAYFNTSDPDKILEQFGAKLALAIHLADRRLNWRFHTDYACGSSLTLQNITITGDVMDLDEVGKDSSKVITRAPGSSLDYDLTLAREAISKMSKIVTDNNVTAVERSGLNAFNEIIEQSGRAGRAL